MNDFTKKIKSKKGFTLVEMLVVVAILGLLTLSISTAMTATFPTYVKSVTHSESSVLFSTLTKSITDELRYARDITVDSAKKLDTFRSYTYGSNSKFSIDSSGNVDTTDTTTGQVCILGKDGVNRPLIGSGSYTNLTVTLDISYNDTKDLFTVDLKAFSGATEVNGIIYQVAPLNPIP